MRKPAWEQTKNALNLPFKYLAIETTRRLNTETILKNMKGLYFYSYNFHKLLQSNIEYTGIYTSLK